MLSSAFPIFCINVFVTFAVVTLKAYSGLRVSFEEKQKKRPEENTKMT